LEGVEEAEHAEEEVAFDDLGDDVADEDAGGEL